MIYMVMRKANCAQCKKIVDYDDHFKNFPKHNFIIINGEISGYW